MICLVIIFENNFEKKILKIVFENYYFMFYKTKIYLKI